MPVPKRFGATKRVARTRLRPGDLLTFKSCTRDSFRVATRVIRDFDHLGRPLVGYASWSDFVVQPDEIISAARRIG